MPSRVEPPGHSESSECPVFLSPKQKQVLVLVAQGHTDEAIATRLRRSPRTVRAHLQAVYRALGAVNRANAVALAFVWGLIDLDTFLAKSKNAV